MKAQAQIWVMLAVDVPGARYHSYADTVLYRGKCLTKYIKSSCHPLNVCRQVDQDLLQS